MKKAIVFVMLILAPILTGCDVDCTRIKELSAQGASFIQTAPDTFAVVQNGMMTGETIKADTFIRCR